MEHSLIGKTVTIKHGKDMGFPYMPVVILEIEEPYIKIGPVPDEQQYVYNGGAGFAYGALVPLWVPIAECKNIVEIEIEGR
jgi:hypothetical protein